MLLSWRLAAAPPSAVKNELIIRPVAVPLGYGSWYFRISCLRRPTSMKMPNRARQNCGGGGMGGQASRSALASR